MRDRREQRRGGGEREKKDEKAERTKNNCLPGKIASHF